MQQRCTRQDGDDFPLNEIIDPDCQKNTSLESETQNLKQIQQQIDQLSKQDWDHITKDKPLIINASHQIIALAISPNGKQIASAGKYDYSIHIWDPITGSQLGKSLEGHWKDINSIDYSKCGKFIVSSSDDKTIRQWDAQNHCQIGETMIGHRDDITGVQYSPDQRYIISCSRDKTIRIWDLKTGIEQIDKRFRHINTIQCLSLSPIKNEVAFGCIEITIWDYVEYRQSRQALKGHTQQIRSIEYSTDGSLIISGSNNTIHIWHSQTLKQIRQFTRELSYVWSVNISPDSKYIVSGGYDRTVRLWDLVTGQQIGQNLTHHQNLVSSAQFSSCGTYMITGGDSTIWIMRAPTV